MEKVFLVKGYLSQKDYYVTAPKSGQSLNEFITQHAAKDFCVAWRGQTSNLNEGVAKIYVDMSLKNSFGQQLYRDYRYPNDTVHSIRDAYESIITAINALSDLMGFEVSEVVIFHN